MSQISALFNKTNHKALITYTTVGYPSIEATLEIVPAMVEGGSDIIELGIPFSDPLADGTTIQRASHEALQRGITPQRCIEIARQLRDKLSTPLVFMSYFNPLFHYGLDRFLQASSNAGIDGLIVPDLPPEEGTELERLAGNHHIDLIYLITPVSSEQRMRLVAARSSGFIYAVSLTGVTGTRGELPPYLEDFISKIHSITSKPVCVGFGISTPTQAHRVAIMADGVILGSRIVEIVESSKKPAEAVRAFVQDIRTAISSH